MLLRTMTEADIPAGMRLKELAGWNQSVADWKRFLAADAAGCFVAEIDGQVRGTAASICFEHRFAWVGMVLVDPEYRGRGIGTALLECELTYLDSQNIPTIKLDATPQGKPIYEKLGFVSEYEIERWTWRRTGIDDSNSGARDRYHPLSDKLWNKLCTTDAEIFGADRSSLLRSLHQDAPEFTIAISDGDELQGYTLGRRGAFADHLGPWMAQDASTAGRLLETFLARSRRETVIVDSLHVNPFVLNLVKSAGFTYSRPLTRMYRGSNRHPGRPSLLCSIMGPEFG